MTVLVKRLAKNEAGNSDAATKHGILIPKTCVHFFPALGPEPNPRLDIRVSFRAEGRTFQSVVSFIYYNRATRNEHRISRVPKEFTATALPGDFLVLQTSDSKKYQSHAVHSDSPLHSVLLTEIGTTGGKVLSDTEYESICGPFEMQSALDISIAIPEGVSDDEVERIVCEFLGKADDLHRSHGGSGLRIESLEIETPILEVVTSE